MSDITNFLTNVISSAVAVGLIGAWFEARFQKHVQIELARMQSRLTAQVARATEFNNKRTQAIIDICEAIADAETKSGAFALSVRDAANVDRSCLAFPHLQSMKVQALESLVKLGSVVNGRAFYFEPGVREMLGQLQSKMAKLTVTATQELDHGGPPTDAADPGIGTLRDALFVEFRSLSGGDASTSLAST